MFNELHRDFLLFISDREYIVNNYIFSRRVVSEHFDLKFVIPIKILAKATAILVAMAVTFVWR